MRENAIITVRTLRGILLYEYYVIVCYILYAQTILRTKIYCVILLFNVININIYYILINYIIYINI